jgi:hypothetical protein
MPRSGHCAGLLRVESRPALSSPKLTFYLQLMTSISKVNSFLTVLKIVIFVGKPVSMLLHLESDELKIIFLKISLDHERQLENGRTILRVRL